MFSLFIGMVSILVTIYKIENKKANRIMVINGILLAIVMLFFHYYIQLSLYRIVPLFSTIFSTLQIIIITYIIFNRFYKNSFIESIIKTGITILVGVLTQISVMFLIPLVSLVLPYDAMMEFMSYVAQLWTIAFMFLVYPKFKNRIDLIVKDFSEHPKYVFGSLFYFFGHIIIVTHARAFLIDNLFLLFIFILISLVVLIHSGFLMYKYFIKLKEGTVDKSINQDIIEG